MQHISTQTEIWKPVVGCEGYYEVSDHGRVRSLDRQIINSFGVRQFYRGKLMTLSTEVYGYKYIRTSIKAHHTMRKVHRLVLESFVGPCPPGMECRHMDGNPANNHLSNLQWGTLSENQYDITRHGRSQQASRTHCPRGHAHSSQNNPPSAEKIGRRSCLACIRARSYARGWPDREGKLQEISDSYYAAIMSNSK